MLLRRKVWLSATTAVLIVSTALAGFAAAAGPVVPPGGKAAGEGYAYYLERSWQIFFSAASRPKPCNTIAVRGQRVAMLLGGYSGKPERHTCSVPAGRPVYFAGIGAECSTLPGDHGKFGTTDSELKRCARAMYVDGHAGGRASVDGRPVADLAKTVVATGMYVVHLPKKNALGVKQRTGRSTAYGEGLLLSGFTRGTHVVHLTGALATFKADVTDTVKVR